MRSKLPPILVACCALLALAAVPASAADGPAIDGVLELVYVDAADGSAELQHFVTERASGQRYRIVSAEPLPDSLRSGSYVLVYGERSEAEELVRVSGAAAIEVSRTIARGAAIASGQRRAVVLIADLQDATVQCSAEDIAQGMYSGALSVDGLYRDNSRDEISFDPDGDLDGQPDVFGPFTISFSSGTCNRYSYWAAEVDALATAAGVNLALYQHKVYVLPRYTDVGCSFAGIAHLGCTGPCSSWILECESPMVFAHELGHNLGLSHAGAADTGSSYGDLSDPMGATRAWTGFNAPHRAQLGTVDAFSGSLVDVTGDGVYSLRALDEDPALAAGAQVLRITDPATQEPYFVSYRRRAGYDATLPDPYPDATNVHRQGGPGLGATWFLGSLTHGEELRPANASFSVTQLADLGDGASVEVRFDTLSSAANDTCATATPIGVGTYDVSTLAATASGQGVCGSSEGSPDVWFEFRPDGAGWLQVDTQGSGLDAVLSLYYDCSPSGDFSCDDDCDENPGDSQNSCLSTFAAAGAPWYIRVSGYGGLAGETTLVVRFSGDADVDGIEDEADNCPDYDNGDQLDTDKNGVGDACECGDANGDGYIHSSDVFALAMCIVQPASCTLDLTIADANNDGVLNYFDAYELSLRIQDSTHRLSCPRNP